MLEKKKIVIIGGAGYIGSHLTIDLLSLGYKVIVIDNFIYGNPFPFAHHRLQKIKADVRNLSEFVEILNKSFAIIHLACVSNDPSFDLDPKYSKSVNLDCFPALIKSVKNFNIDRFIYASSSSVYGIKKEENVTEDLSLNPLTDYSKFKAECEQILMNSNLGGTAKIILRPATVCGPSLRQRLDVVVNIFAANAYFNKKLTVFGGKQLRPNIHIADMCRAYVHILGQNNTIIDESIYNVGFENISVSELARNTIEIVGHDVEVETSPTSDMRSYKINSDKITSATGFKPNLTVRDGIYDLVEAFKLGHCRDAMRNPIYKNIDLLKTYGFGK